MSTFTYIFFPKQFFNRRTPPQPPPHPYLFVDIIIIDMHLLEPKQPYQSKKKLL